MTSVANARAVMLPLTLLVGLVVLDLAATVLAKEWSNGRSATWFWAEAIVHLGLFVLCARLLSLMQLPLLNFAWILILQIALVVVDHVRYGADFHGGQLAAIGGMVALQAYLMLSVSSG